MLFNALVHRNYMGARKQMRVYDDRITLWNVGKLPNELTEAGLLKPHSSLPRNPIIAHACYLAGYIDTWGSGTLKIIEACKKEGLPEPVIKEMQGGIEVTMFKIGITEQVTTEVTEQATEQVEKLIKVFMFDEYTSAEIQEKLELKHRPTFLYNYLQPALEHGLIEMTIPDKPKSSKQKYRLTEKGKGLKT